MQKEEYCWNCVYYNGEQGDGEQFCDELEVYTHENRWCNKWRMRDENAGY